MKKPLKKKFKTLSLIVLTGISLLSNAQEKHLKNIKKCTFGGDNAEAYFSPNSNMLTLQVTNNEIGTPALPNYAAPPPPSQSSDGWSSTNPFGSQAGANTNSGTFDAHNGLYRGATQPPSPFNFTCDRCSTP